jgi:hypothetical protein
MLVRERCEHASVSWAASKQDHPRQDGSLTSQRRAVTLEGSCPLGENMSKETCSNGAGLFGAMDS